MSIDRENGLRIAKVGVPTLCATCIHGCMVTTRSVPSPEAVASWLIEHEGVKDIEDSPFRVIDEVSSWCASPRMTSQMYGAVKTPRVTECEGYMRRVG